MFPIVGSAVVLSVLILATKSCSSDANPDTIVMDGHHILIGAFPVHGQGNGSDHCGQLQTEDGLELMLAMFHVLETINKARFLPVTLGAVAIDTCDNPTHTLHQCVDFLRYLVLRDTNTTINVNNGSVDYRKIVGLVGAYSSDVSAHAASLLQLFQLPQISYASTSYILSDRSRYSYFMRTVPNDKSQSKAIADILYHFNWTYVSVLYEDSQYGQEGAELFDDFASDYNLCSALRLRVKLYQSELYYRNIIHRLKFEKKSRVVILYMNSDCVRSLFLATKQLEFDDDFIWIGTDGWSGRLYPVEGLETVATQALTLQPISGWLPGFQDYYDNLKATGSDKAWIKEFIATTNYTRGEWTDHLGHVSDAVYAFAYALRDYYAEFCTGLDPSACHIDLEKLHRAIQTVNFTGSTGLEFSFANGVDPIARYKLMTYEKVNHKFQWSQIGRYYTNERNKLLFSNLNRRRMYQSIVSRCSEPCSVGQAKIMTDTCCFACADCARYQFLASESECQDCPAGWQPTANRSHCVEIPESVTEWTDSLSLVPLCFTGFCLLLTLITFAILAIHHDTPTVMACGRESSIILFLGILLLYSNTVVFFARPNYVTCTLIRLFLGMSYTICYAAILTKTNRIARIFDPSNRGDKVSHVKPISQILIIVALCTVEIVILVVWLVVQRPKPNFIIAEQSVKYCVCAAQGYTYLIALIYPLILLLLSTLYAFKTRKAPIGFNEARLLAFTNYTNLVIWLVFIPTFFAGMTPVSRRFTLALITTLSGLVSLTCFFATRAYVILFRPEKNTKEAVMQPASSSSSTSATTARYNRQISANSYMNEGVSINSDLDKDISPGEAGQQNARRISIIETSPELTVTRI